LKPFSLEGVLRRIKGLQYLSDASTAGPLAVIAAMACLTLPQELRAQSGSGRPPYTEADVRFMTGMIVHHGQAVLIAGWAPSHGASRAVRTLCERIVVAQQDEIAFMQRWLRERHEMLPSADPQDPEC
jgi:uncharacterized protein (DUF305 family)